VSFDRTEAGSINKSLSRVATVHRTATILVLAIGASIVLYTVIGLVVVGQEAGRARVEQPPLAFITGVIFLAFGATTLRRTQLRQIRLQAVAGARGVDGLIKHLFTTTIITTALAEMIGMLGLMVSFFGGGQFYVIIFGLVGLVVLLASYPRRAAWEKIVEYFAATMPQ
jgi:sulfite exporter TauE/SafE